MATTPMAKSAVELTVNQFLAAFLPPSDSTICQGDIDKNPFKSLENVDSVLPREELAELFLSAVDDHHILADAVLSRYTPFSDDTTPSIKSDTAIFHCEQVQSESLPSCFDQSVPVVFSHHSVGGDPFDRARYDDEYGEIKEERGQVLGEISAIANLLFSAQHRLFLFVVLIIGRRFRLLRLDHAGIVVSAPVNYISDASVLCDALHRLCALDDSSLGVDPTATRVLPGDRDFRRMDIAALKSLRDVDHSERDLDTPFASPVTFAYARDLFDASITSGWPRYRIQIQHGDKWRDFLVGKPTFRADGIIGRGTRGYVALDCETNRFVWLKDVWRAAYAIAVPEGDMLQRLNDAGVENVPTLVCHGDVDDHVTVTADYWEPHSADPSSRSPDSQAMCPIVNSPQSASKKRKRTTDDEEDIVSSPSRDRKTHDSSDDSHRPLRQHKHYRIVVEEVAFPLTHFKNGKQLASLVLDALRAHYQAATHPRTLLLHGDIRPRNILIYPQVRHDDEGDKAAIVWTGLLCDWELAKPVDHRRQMSTASSSQIGTYQFKSLNLLRQPSQPTQISDELESFFHALLYFAVRFLRSTCTAPSVWIDNYFHHYPDPEHTHVCGQKWITIEDAGQLRTQSSLGLLRFANPLDTVFAELLSCFKAHYKVLNYELEKAQADPPQLRDTVPTPSAPASTPSSPPERRFVLARRGLRELTDEDLAIRAQIRAELDNWAPSDSTPSAEDRELASKVADHTFMVELFERVLRDGDWPEDDRIATVQPVADTEEPEPGSKPSCDAHPSPKKRQRTVPEIVSAVP